MHVQTPPLSCAGELPGRALQVWRWMYADGAWMSNMRDTVGVNSGLSQKFVDKARQVEGGDAIVDRAGML